MASNEDDLIRQPVNSETLAVMSIEALNSYISDLRQEIEKVEHVIKNKRKAANAANSIFKT